MNHPQIRITVKDFGTMTAELYPEYAPITVENFLKLARERFFDGLIFHRIISGFMLQGGGYNAQMGEKRADAIRGEFAMNGCKTNTLKHTRGVLSMARTNDPNSASSQFFIMHAPAPYLDGQYAAFGKVIEGDAIIDQIANVETGNYGWYMQDVPLTPVIIESIEIISE
ncbi:MAG: peptidylprolyl isomerase [Clostridia bacterium]|nr:peptidylprolyl isomerase [Clostridia bacterium]